MLTQEAVIKLILQYIGGSKLQASKNVILNDRAAVTQTAALSSVIDKLNEIGQSGEDIRDSILHNPKADIIARVKAQLIRVRDEINNDNTVSNANKSTLTISFNDLIAKLDLFLLHTSILSGSSIVDLFDQIDLGDIIPELEAIRDAAQGYANASASSSIVSGIYANVALQASGIAQTAFLMANAAASAANTAAQYAADAAANALTSRNIANVFAISSATSAQTATEASSTAATAAGVAVSAANNANNLAQAAAVSAQQANAYSNSAGNFASAAEASYIAANTKASEANAWSSASATSATAAASFANNSEQSASAAETFMLQANTHRASANVSAFNAASASQNATDAAASAILYSNLAVTAASSANASASAAAVSLTAAVAAANSSSQSANAAQGWAIAANTSAGNAYASELSAIGSAANAAGSSSQAATAAVLAVQSANNANTSAAASAGSAAAAQTFANSSYASSQASQASELAAATSANNAQSNAISAQNSAVAASSNASSANSSSVLAARYASQALATAGRNFVRQPSFNASLDHSGWAEGGQFVYFMSTSPYTYKYALHLNTRDTLMLPAGQYIEGDFGGRKMKINFYGSTQSGGYATRPGFWYRNSSGNLDGIVTTTQILPGNWNHIEEVITLPAGCTGINPWILCGSEFGYGSAPSSDIVYFTVEDVTESQAAQTFAISANTSAVSANSSASSANSSATLAAGYVGSANAYAAAAAASAVSSNSSASSANSYAVLAASYSATAQTIQDLSWPNDVGPNGSKSYDYAGDDATNFNWAYGPDSSWPTPWITYQPAGSGGTYNRIIFKKKKPKVANRRYRVTCWFYTTATNASQVYIWALNTNTDAWDGSATGRAGYAVAPGCINGAAPAVGSFTKVGVDIDSNTFDRNNWSPVFEFQTTGGAPNGVWHVSGMTVEDITSEYQAASSAAIAQSSATSANSSAASANSSATLAAGYVGSANAYAAAAAAAAANANSSAASASSSATLAAQYGTGGGNLVPNSDFVDVSGWSFYSPYAGSNFEGGGVPMRNIAGDDWRPTGENNISIRQVNGDTSVWAQVFCNSISVTANAWYEFSAWSAAHRCDTAVRIDWYRADNSAITSSGGTFSSSNSGGRNINNWTRKWIKAQAPSDAAWCYVVLLKNPTYSGQSDSYAWWVRPMLREVPSSHVSPAIYAPSPNKASVTTYAGVAVSAQGAASTALARAGVRLDVNGYVSGYEIASTGTSSDFNLNADTFRIVKPGGGARTEYSDGNWRVYDANNVLRVRMGVW